ncbi:MAG: hypothetical protein JJ714_10425, partial [Acidithiobacillus sp.]|nr:hypothetical protein [Acidithiobacillus sp.]
MRKITFATAAFLLASPVCSLAHSTLPTIVKTPFGFLSYSVDRDNFRAIVKGDRGTLSSFSGAFQASNDAPINTQAGSAILLDYNSGGNGYCTDTYQWFSVLPGGTYKFGEPFGSCYQIEDIHAHGGDVLFKEINVFGKGYKIVRYDVTNGSIVVLSSHMAPADTPKIVVTTDDAFIPVYGTIVRKVSRGKVYYKFDFPEKVEITGSDSSGNFYMDSIDIRHLSVPTNDIGKPMHFMANILAPM